MSNFLSFAHTLVIFGKLLKPCDFLSLSLSSYLMRAQRPVVPSPTTIITFLLEFSSPAVNFIPTLHSHHTSLTLSHTQVVSRKTSHSDFTQFSKLFVYDCVGGRFLNGMRKINEQLGGDKEGRKRRARKVDCGQVGFPFYYNKKKYHDGWQ